MKKQSFLIVTFFLLIPLLQAQQSRFPINPGSVWRINFEFDNSCSGEDFVHYSGDEEFKYFIDGDTIIGSRTYFRLYKTGVIYLETPFYVFNQYTGAIRDSADKVFYLDKEEDSEKLLYDFTVNIGDMIDVEGGVGYPVAGINTLPDGRKQFELDIITAHCGSANTFIEGIGWLGGLLEGNSCSGHPGVRGSYLVCYSENGEVIYLTDKYRCYKQVACDDIVVSTNYQDNPKAPEVIVLPGKSLVLSVSNDRNGIYEIEIYNAAGQICYYKKSSLSSPIDISMLESGVYVLKLGYQGNSHTGKFVVQ